MLHLFPLSYDFGLSSQAKDQLSPNAYICPSVVKIWGVLVESQDLVDMNEVCKSPLCVYGLYDILAISMIY